MEIEKENTNWPGGATTLAAGALAAAFLPWFFGNGRGVNGPNFAQENSDLKAEIAQLKAQEYADNKYAVLLERTAKNEVREADQREISRLENEVAVLKSSAALSAQINTVALAGVQSAGAIAALQQAVGNIAKFGIPESSIVAPFSASTNSNAGTGTTNG